jgi:hypothetical protein
LNVADLGAVAILGLQGLVWLRDGFWEEWPLSRAWLHVFNSIPSTDWVGAQMILSMVFDFPLSVYMVAIGVAAAALGAVIEAVA